METKHSYRVFCLSTSRWCGTVPHPDRRPSLQEPGRMAERGKGTCLLKLRWLVNPDENHYWRRLRQQHNTVILPFSSSI